MEGSNFKHNKKTTSWKGYICGSMFIKNFQHNFVAQFACKICNPFFKGHTSWKICIVEFPLHVRFTILNCHNYENIVPISLMTWHHILYHDIIIRIMTSQYVSWHHILYRDITMRIISQYLSWHHILYHHIIFSTMTSQCVSWRHNTYHDIIYSIMTSQALLRNKWIVFHKH